MNLQCSFRFDSIDLVPSERAAEWLESHRPLPPQVVCVVNGSPAQWEACGTKLTATGGVQAPCWFAKSCVLPCLAWELWNGANANTTILLDKDCFEAGAREYDKRCEQQDKELLLESLAVVECEEFAATIEGHMQELVKEGCDTRGAVIEWTVAFLSAAASKPPLVNSRNLGSYKLRERGSPPPAALAVLKLLREAVVQLRSIPLFPPSLRCSVDAIARIEVANFAVKGGVPKVWTGVPLHLHVPGTDPVLAIWNADIRHLEAG